jgi:uncharacterized protein YegL
MALTKVNIHLPNSANVLENEIEETMLINDIVESLKNNGNLDKAKHYIVKSIAGTFIPSNVNFREYNDSEIKILESPVAISDFGGEVADNPSARCLLVLVIDTSYSMRIAIVEVNRALQVLADEIKKDAVARKRIEVTIISFNSSIEVVQEPKLVDEFIMPILQVTGTTKMVDAMRTAINYVESRKKWYKDQKLSYLRPHIVLLTDGEPDADQDINGLSEETKIGEQDRRFVLMPIGVAGANKNTLEQMAQSNYPPQPLDGYEFVKLFKWLSNSMAAISKSRPGEKVVNPKPDWIATGWGSGIFN